MRSPLFLLLVLLLLAGCSWADFNAGVQNAVDSINNLFSSSGFAENSTDMHPRAVLACSDEACLRNALGACTMAEGTLDMNGTSIRMFINSSKDSCLLNITVVDGPSAGSSLWCIFPFSRGNSLEEVISPEASFCDGSWYDLGTPRVNITGPVHVPSVVVGNSQVSFNITAQRTIYLQSVVLTSPRLKNCNLSYANPVKLKEGVPAQVVIDCSTSGRGPHVFGSAMLTYFEKPDFRKPLIAAGSFVT